MLDLAPRPAVSFGNNALRFEVTVDRGVLPHARGHLDA